MIPRSRDHEEGATKGVDLDAVWRRPVAMADAILRLRDHAEERAGLGRRGHEAARELYHWPHAARAFLDALEGWAAETAAARRR